VTRVFFDTEFLEDGERIHLISIGMVREDGAEYYAVSDDATKRPLNGRIRKSEWLMANVVPSLPQAPADWNVYQPGRWLFDYAEACVKPRRVIAREVRDFILAAPDPELWAWFAAYDHVVLAQLWGRMIDLPDGIPMWTNDLKQEAERLGNPPLPSMPRGRQHHALDDAREVKFRYEWLAAQEAGRVVRAEPKAAAT
jgi:3' exoribonuclease, RNase T-like